MNAQEHADAARKLLAFADTFSVGNRYKIAILTEAQVHATLALVAVAEQAGVCDHGNTGVCMYCLIPVVESAIEHGLQRLTR